MNFRLSELNMKLKLVVLVLGLQTAWILGTTIVQERGLAAGKVVLLETQPADPRDLLRGDYITLNYKISTVPSNLFSPPLTNGLPAGTTVFVALEPRGTFYELASASTESLSPANGRVVLRGRAQSWWDEKTVHLEYGLERYYVREGAGNPQGKITVQVAVPNSGRGQIKAVFIDGKPFTEAMRGVGR
jgi:uncharacterized membrane-anchored protein